MTKVCIKCNHRKDESRFTKGCKRCKCCEWFEKHKFVYPNGWDKEKTNQMLEMIFDGKIKYLNELENIVNKPIEDIVDLISNKLCIHNIGNQKLIVQKRCLICGKTFETHIGRFWDRKFCSHDCYSKYRSIYLTGENASVYNKTKTKCTYCGNEMLLPKNRFMTKNKEGKNHHFCTKECYYEFRKIYYVGDKLYNTGLTMSDEFKEQC